MKSARMAAPRMATPRLETAAVGKKSPAPPAPVLARPVVKEMKMTRLFLEKLHLARKEFVTAAELKEFAAGVDADYDRVVKNMLRRKFLVRVFRGLFYVKTIEEIYGSASRYYHLEMLARAMDLKGVKNWYFGLHTALDLNNMTHEYFTNVEIISDSVFRPSPVKILDGEHTFRKLSPSLFGFGTKKHGTVRYSDPEKTLLDFLYLGKHRGYSDDWVLRSVYDWTTGLAAEISTDRMKRYSRHYPRSVRNLVPEVGK